MSIRASAHPIQIASPLDPDPAHPASEDSDWEAEAIADALLGRQSHPKLLLGPTASISRAASCLEEGQLCEDEPETSPPPPPASHDHPNTLTPVEPAHHHSQSRFIIDRPPASFNLLDRLGPPSRASNNLSTTRRALRLEASATRETDDPKTPSTCFGRRPADPSSSRRTPPKRARHSPSPPPRLPSSSYRPRRRRASLSSRITPGPRRDSCSPLPTRHELPPKPPGTTCRSTSPHHPIHQITRSHPHPQSINHSPRSDIHHQSINDPRNCPPPEPDHPPSQPRPSPSKTNTPHSKTKPQASRSKNPPRSNPHDYDQTTRSSVEPADDSQAEAHKASVQITNLPPYSVLTPKRLYEHLVDSVPNQRSEPLLPYQLNLYRYSRSDRVCAELKFSTLAHARNFVEWAERSWPSIWYSSTKTCSESRNKKIDLTIIHQDHPVTWPSYFELYSVKNRSDSYRPSPRDDEDESIPSENQSVSKDPTPHPNQSQTTVKRRSNLMATTPPSSQLTKNLRTSSLKTQSDCYRPSKVRVTPGDRRKFGNLPVERQSSSRVDQLNVDKRSRIILTHSSAALSSNLRQEDNQVLPPKDRHDRPSNDQHEHDLSSGGRRDLLSREEHPLFSKDGHELPSKGRTRLPYQKPVDQPSKCERLPSPGVKNALPSNEFTENERTQAPPRGGNDLLFTEKRIAIDSSPSAAPGLPPQNKHGLYSEWPNDPSTQDTRALPSNDEDILSSQNIALSASNSTGSSTAQDANSFPTDKNKISPINRINRPSVKPPSSLFAKHRSDCLEQKPSLALSRTHPAPFKPVPAQASTSSNVPTVPSSQVTNEINPSPVTEPRAFESSNSEDADLKFLETLFSSEEMKQEARDRRNSVLLSKLKPSISFSVLQSHFLIPNRPRHFRIFEPIQISYGPFHNLITDRWIHSSVDRATHYGHQNPHLDVGCLISFTELQTASHFLKVLKENPPFEPMEPVLVDPTTIQFDASASIISNLPKQTHLESPDRGYLANPMLQEASLSDVQNQFLPWSALPPEDATPSPIDISRIIQIAEQGQQSTAGLTIQPEMSYSMYRFPPYLHEFHQPPPLLSSMTGPHHYHPLPATNPSMPMHYPPSALYDPSSHFNSTNHAQPIGSLELADSFNLAGYVQSSQANSQQEYQDRLKKILQARKAPVEKR